MTTFHSSRVLTSVFVDYAEGREPPKDKSLGSLALGPEAPIVDLAIAALQPRLGYVDTSRARGTSHTRWSPYAQDLSALCWCPAFVEKVSFVVRVGWSRSSSAFIPARDMWCTTFSYWSCIKHCCWQYLLVILCNIDLLFLSHFLLWISFMWSVYIACLVDIFNDVWHNTCIRQLERSIYIWHSALYVLDASFVLDGPLWRFGSKFTHVSIDSRL